MVIATKHVSLQIRPEHYPIVGENLLKSLQELLNLKPDDPVIKAWGEGYQVLADVLIKMEDNIYNEQKIKNKGWTGFKKFKIFKKVKESNVVTSYYLKPIDGSDVPDHIPGQFITVRVPTSDGSTAMRNYSLSNKRGENYYRISIKKEEDYMTLEGSVSNKFHREFNENDEIEVAPPCGDFHLKQYLDKPLVLLGGGIGVTPLISILLSSLEETPKREIVFVHGN